MRTCSKCKKPFKDGDDIVTINDVRDFHVECLAEKIERSLIKIIEKSSGGMPGV
ncbi:MAG: hypothetical protein ACTSRA_00905 [Promethearchaeota archaeon]